MKAVEKEEEEEEEEEGQTNRFEERNNVLKEDRLRFGEVQLTGIRILGCWVDPIAETRNRISRIAKLWTKVRL